MKTGLKNITGIKGTLFIDNFPIPIHLNGTESICFDENKMEMCFINNVLMFNPNDNKEYLVDIIFTGHNSFYADFVLSTDEESCMRVYFYGCDEYGKYFEIVLHEEE